LIAIVWKICCPRKGSDFFLNAVLFISVKLSLYFFQDYNHCIDIFVEETQKVNSLFSPVINIKGTVHARIIFLKYVMLITVNKNFTVIITNRTWYQTKGNKLNYWRAVFMTAPDVRFKSRKEKSQMLWCHLGQQDTEFT